MVSCSYSCTTDHPVGDRSANLISFFVLFIFVAIDVKLANRSSILPLDICCWLSCMAKRNFCVEIKLVLITFCFYIVSVWLISLRRRFHVFAYLSLHTFKFFVEIVEHQIQSIFWFYFLLGFLKSTLFSLSLFRGLSLLLRSSFSFHIKFYLLCSPKFRRREVAFWNTIVASRYVSNDKFICLLLED